MIGKKQNLQQIDYFLKKDKTMRLGDIFFPLKKREVFEVNGRYFSLLWT